MKDWKGMERTVAKQLGTWWGCEFRRTPSSGAWGKQTFSKHSSKASDNFHGDIVAPKEAKFPFSVECKAYKEVELYKALYGSSNIYSWWSQCVNDTPKGMYPMLVMKENRKAPLVAISDKCYKRLVGSLPVALPHMTLSTGKTIHIFDLASFIQALDADTVMELL